MTYEEMIEEQKKNPLQSEGYKMDEWAEKLRKDHEAR